MSNQKLTMETPGFGGNPAEKFIAPFIRKKAEPEAAPEVQEESEVDVVTRELRKKAQERGREYALKINARIDRIEHVLWRTKFAIESPKVSQEEKLMVFALLLLDEIDDHGPI